MPNKLILIAFFIFLSVGLYSQRSPLELTFTAVDNGVYVQLDSIKIMNRTEGGEIMVYWPDTAVSLEINPGDLLLFIGYATFSTVGIHEIGQERKSFRLFQNYPNPAYGESLVSLMIQEEGTLRLAVTDIQGKVVIAHDMHLESGHHSFRFTPGAGQLFLLSATYEGMTRSIKIVHPSPEQQESCRLDYVGGIEIGRQVPLKSIETGIVKQSGILDQPSSNSDYNFQFATSIPCPGTPMIEYEGQVYSTIQIFSQCWLKENLNVGIMIDGTMEQSNNGTIEKYCFDNEPDSCTKYGGLYQWHEMMQYTTLPGAQGICPPGWHLPTDEEWKVLEGSVDSLYGIGNNFWNEYGYRGTDAGANLKTTSGWIDNGNGTDLFGFSCLPGGIRVMGGYFGNIESFGFYWSSSEGSNDNFWYRIFDYSFPTVDRIESSAEGGLSVRCLRDY